MGDWGKRGGGGEAKLEHDIQTTPRYFVGVCP